MKIVVFSGSPRRKDSYSIIKQLEAHMNKNGDVSFEYISLKELEIKECVGCMQCFEKGEQYCPLKDDAQLLRKKLVEADGIIFASPVYAIHITGTMKRVIDRLAFMFHRPELIGKPAVNIVTTAGGGLKPVQDYLKLTACGWGCNLVDSIPVISTLYFKNSEYHSSKYAAKLDKKVEAAADRLYEAILHSCKPVPTFYDIYMFHGLKSKSLISKADHDFWQENGWLDSSYYYKVKLNPIKQLFGKTLDFLIKMMFKKMTSQQSTK